MSSLPDYLAPGLAIVSVGINPSLPSARAGYAFANPRNRFWPALNGSRLVEEVLTPGVAAIECLFLHHRIGFTDIVKRPSAMEKNLDTAELREGAALLRDKLLRYQPRIVWFHGKTPYEKLLQYGFGQKLKADWGLQPEKLEGMRCFVTPNPSPANAAFSLQDLIGWYDRLAALRDQPE